MIRRYFSPWNANRTNGKEKRKKGKESECLTECEESQGNVCTSFRRERILRGKKRIDSLSE